MSGDECFPLLLSHRERSALELQVLDVVSKAEVAELPDRHELPEDAPPREPPTWTGRFRRR
ncbi:hypothetical protein GA0115245_106317 [Streptomyces sp. di188]|nr:hypothetical protein GA0115245_106317 [Streptomyces sp. di188]SCE00774.1 hypothetical protein GA0115238_142018 [Streptomyces sp. di50b]